MMFQLWARVIESSTRNTKLSTSSRGASRGRKASRPRARSIPRVQARSVLPPGLLISSALRKMMSRGVLASSRKRSSGAPEHALWPEHKYDEEDDQPDHLAVRPAEGGRAERLGDAHEEACREGAEHGPEAGQHHHDQGLERPLEADGRADRVADAHQRARGAGQRGAEGEGQQVRAPDVDAGEERGLPV